MELNSKVHKTIRKIVVLRASSVAMFVKSIVVFLDKLVTGFVVLVTVAVIVAVSTAPNQEPINRNEQLLVCHGVFTDQLIFPPENRIFMAV